VFENRVLRRIFGPKRFEVIGGGKELRDVELRDCIIRKIKLTKMRWAGHVARIGGRGMRIGY
jgi:hypothetical protein